MANASPKLTAEDRLEIIDLLARYARNLDARDSTALSRTFAPDGAMSSPRTGAIRGREAIRATVEQVTADWGMQVRHQSSLPVIEGDADRCYVRSYTQVLVQTPEGPCAVSEVVDYQDTCVKQNGAWYFQERKVTRVLQDAILQARVDGAR
jgi:uncharacterized protein (TIGR02246 family)